MSSYFDALGRELVSAAERNAPPASATRPRRLPRPARPLFAALVALVLVVPAAAAVREVFTPVREGDGIVRLSKDNVVARGVLPVRGRWEMVASDSDVGACLGIRFLDDSAGGLGGGCGPPPEARLVVGSSGGGSDRLHRVYSGVAPAQANVVRVVDSSDRVLDQVSTQPGPSSYPGAYFAIEVSTSRQGGCVQALNRDGVVLEEVSTDRLTKGCS